MPEYSPPTQADVLSRAIRAYQTLLKENRRNGNSAINPREVSYTISENLRWAGADYAALDPDSKKSAVEIFDIVTAELKIASLRSARSRYSVLEYDLDPEERILDIHMHLDDAGVGLTALDPTGVKTEADINADFARAITGAHVRWARMLFHRLPNTEHPHRTIKQIHESLALGEADITALYEDNSRSASDINREVVRLMKTAHIRNARKAFRDVGTWKDSNSEIKEIMERLKNADAGFEALDPDNTRSAADMITAILNAGKDGISDANREHLNALLDIENAQRPTPHGKNSTSDIYMNAKARLMRKVAARADICAAG